MLGVKGYTQEYIDDCRARINEQVSSYDKLRNIALQQAGNEEALEAAIDRFEANFFNNMVLLLDWLFVHRLRTVELKDGNPLNEVRVICNSLTLNNARMTAEKSIKLDPKTSVLKIQFGDEIRLNQDDFERLSAAFFTEIESKFLETSMVEA